MRTKDELFREALRHIAARRQQAVTAAERDRAAALAAHPELRAAEDAPVRVLSAADAGADSARCGLAGSPTQVVRSFVPERSGAAERVEGTAAGQAAKLVDLLGGMGL